MTDAAAAFRASAHAAQRVAGVIAARHRGDLSGADTLAQDLTAEVDEETRAAGAILLADLTVALLARAEGRDVSDVAAELSLHLAAVAEPA